MSSWMWYLTRSAGTYAGGSDRNRWGTVQVQVVSSGGQISDVQTLQ